MYNSPSFKARLLVTAFVEERMVVDVVDVDQFPSLYDVADYAGGERKSHLILLKIQNSAVERERERQSGPNPLSRGISGLSFLRHKGGFNSQK